MAELRRLLTSHPRGLTLHEIAVHLDVTPRSARRYLRAFPAELESETERPSGQKRWRITAADLPRRVALRRTQAYALIAARDLFEPLRGSALYEEIDLATQSLLGVARRPGRGPNAGVHEDASLEQRFRFLPFAPASYAGRAEDLDTVFHAVAELHPLDCSCLEPDGTWARRRLWPYALVFYKDALHCLVGDARDGAVGARSLEHLRALHCVTSERFRIPEDFRVEDYVQGHFGLWRNDACPHAVVVDLDETVASSLLSRRLHPSQQTTALPDGGARLELRLGNLDEVVPWVLSLGAHAEVVAPASLRARVAAELNAARARYLPVAASDAPTTSTSRPPP
ncbi:MAG: WYL domain-containing protein [Myxococcota bacterium]